MYKTPPCIVDTEADLSSILQPCLNLVQISFKFSVTMRVAEQDLVANSSSDPFTPKTVTYIEHLLAKFHVPSISLGIIHKGHTYVRVCEKKKKA